MADCIFCKIAEKVIASEIVYEDAKVMAFNDINPQAPVHVVVIPKQHIETLDDVQDTVVYQDIFQAIDKVTEIKELKQNGYRVVANCKKDGGQDVFHIHFHVLGGRHMNWPPG